MKFSKSFDKFFVGCFAFLKNITTLFEHTYISLLNTAMHLKLRLVNKSFCDVTSSNRAARTDLLIT